MREPGAGGWLIGAALVPLLAVAAAYVSQHRFDMLPCPWCTLQRLIFLLIALAALLALLLRGALPRRLFAGLGLLLAGCGIGAALWQHFVAAASASCNLTLADKILSGLGLDAAWPEMFAPMASCADAAVNLLGVPYAFWSLGLFVLLAIALLRVLRAPH